MEVLIRGRQTHGVLSTKGAAAETDAAKATRRARVLDIMVGLICEGKEIEQLEGDVSTSHLRVLITFNHAQELCHRVACPHNAPGCNSCEAQCSRDSLTARRRPRTAALRSDVIIQWC